MTNLQAKVPKSLARDISYLVKLGLFKDESEVVRVALEKMLAYESREYLRGIAKSMRIKEKEVIEEWKKIRDEEDFC